MNPMEPRSKKACERPKNLRLISIRLPIPALVSILHRATGMLLFLAMPVLIGLFGMSLGSRASFDQLTGLLGHPLAKLMLLGLLWGFLHHFFAGIRHLMLDVHIGLDLRSARRSARWVLAAGFLSTLLIGVMCW